MSQIDLFGHFRGKNYCEEFCVKYNIMTESDKTSEADSSEELIVYNFIKKALIWLSRNEDFFRLKATSVNLYFIVFSPHYS